MMINDPADFPDDCPFCAIARGEDSAAQIVCESAGWVAFFPLGPATPGHTLLIPRVHVANFWEADERIVEELTAAALGVGNAIHRALRPAGMNLISSAGEAAEQTILHLHLHLVPRFAGDRMGPIWPDHAGGDPTTIDGLAKRISDAWASAL